MTSVRKCYTSKSIKRIEAITCRKNLKYILALDEESKKNLVLVTLVHFSLNFWACQCFYYMKFGLTADMLC